MITAVVGINWGDEGKGRMVDLLTEDYVYVPFDANWQPNKHYTYTLVFGLGRNSSGVSNGSDITFTVSTSDWATGTTTNPNLN